MTDTEATPIELDLGGEKVDGLVLRPANAWAMLVFAHGAGADMRHSFMDKMSRALAGVGIATLRYQFPFAQRGGRRPDPRPVLVETAHAAIMLAETLAPDLPLLAGGKSMGGRMTSLAEAEEQSATVKGIVFFGFPLHASGKPGTSRAEHLILI
ncbi:MAG: alpha/beta family hydrolase, partial [Geminicoccaceae bacterium]|nr:alpha/beta family hydrolase [Geminicoccaceae bacterium]